MKKVLSTLVLVLVGALSLSAQTIAINFSGESATVVIPEGVTDVTSSVSGAYVTINSTTTATEYTYAVSGNTDNGGLTINGAYKLTLQLAGVSITSKKGAAIDVECGKRIAVSLVEGTKNTLVDCIGGKQKAALYFSGHPEFSGAGSLTVTGNTKHAIGAKEYLQLKKSVGEITVNGAVSDGIHCGKGKLAGDENEFFIMNGGNVTINNVQGDCIDADDFGSMTIAGGTMILSVEGVDAKGLKCANELTMTGGSIICTVTGDDSDAINCGGTANFNGGTVEIKVEGNGSKGVKCSKKLGAGDLNIDGTDFNITALGGDYITGAGTELADTSHCAGINVEGNITHVSGQVNVTAAGKAVTVKCDGTVTGTINNMQQYFYVDIYAYEYDMSMYAILRVDYDNVTDYSDYEIAAFVGDECRGIYEAQTPLWGYLRIYSNTARDEKVKFVVYKKSTGITYTSTDSIDFLNAAVFGTPSEPVVLHISEKPTGITNVDADAACSQTYTLSGIRVNTNYKGIVIKNGKKVQN